MSLLNDPAHWRARAEEMRKLADTSPDPNAKALLQLAAESYDRLADRAEARLGNSSDKDTRQGG